MTLSERSPRGVGISAPSQQSVDERQEGDMSRRAVEDVREEAKSPPLTPRRIARKYLREPSRTRADLTSFVSSQIDFKADWCGPCVSYLISFPSLLQYAR